MRENVEKYKCDTAHTQNFTFTDPVQPLSLHFVFVGQGHGVKRSSTARVGTIWLGTAGYLSAPASNTDKVQTPSALSALFPGAYRLGTYTCKKKKKKGRQTQTQKNLVRHNTDTDTQVRSTYTHY